MSYINNLYTKICSRVTSETDRKCINTNDYISRIEWIDFYKCIGILLMIMGHIGFGSTFDVWIHGFHMPMFFFISGVLYVSVVDIDNLPSGGIFRLIVRYVEKKAKKILLPYLCIGIFSYVLWLLNNVQYDDYLSPLWHLLWDNSDELPYTGAIWFLTAFFFSSIIYFIIDVIFAKSQNRIIWMTVASTAIGLFGCTMEVRLPWSLNAAFVGVGLMHAGWVLRNIILKNKMFSRDGNIYFLTILIIWGVSVLMILNGSVNMRTGLYQNVFLFWLGAICASFVVCELPKMTCNFVHRHKSLRFIGQYFKSVGENSMVYLCFNQLVIMVVSLAFNSHSESSIEKLIIRLTMFLLTLSVLFIVQWIIEHITAIKIGIGFAWKRNDSFIVMLAWVAALCGSVFVAIVINNCT